ncbi:unnamed protein product [Arctogadus glacialis]
MALRAGGTWFGQVVRRVSLLQGSWSRRSSSLLCLSPNTHNHHHHQRQQQPACAPPDAADVSPTAASASRES